MRKTVVSLCTAALATLLLTSGVRADNVPWGYAAASTEIFNSNNPIMTSSVKFIGASAVATGDSGIIIYNLETTSIADALSPTNPAGPDSFVNAPYDLAVTLTDIQAAGLGKPSGAVKFSGLYSATNVTKNSSLPDGNSFVGPTTAEVVLGSTESGWRKYSVALNSFTPPGQPGGAPGSIQAIVRITPTTDPDGGTGGTEPPANDTPEPASAVLAGLGLPLLLLARRRMKKAQA